MQQKQVTKLFCCFRLQVCFSQLSTCFVSSLCAFGGLYYIFLLPCNLPWKIQRIRKNAPFEHFTIFYTYPYNPLQGPYIQPINNIDIYGKQLPFNLNLKPYYQYFQRTSKPKQSTKVLCCFRCRFSLNPNAKLRRLFDTVNIELR